MLFFCISKYVNLFCIMSFKQAKLTKVKSHCSQVNVLSKICTKKKKKQSETEFHAKAYTRLTHYKRAIKKRNAVDNVLKPGSHRELIQHEVLPKTLLVEAKSYGFGVTMFRASLNAAARASTTLNSAKILLLNMSWASPANNQE